MKRIIGISFILLSAFLFSCQSDKTEIAATEDVLFEKAAQITLTEVQLEAVTTESQYEVEFYANAENTLTRWWKMGKPWKWNGKLRYKINQCPDITIEEENEGGYPKTITLNYGDSTVLNNGKVLSGIIIIEVSAPKKSQDYTRAVTYSNFGVDSLLINGTSSVVTDKLDEMFKQVTGNFIITLANGSVIERSSERIWQWTEGMDTEEDQSDDVIKITGFVNAEMNGENYRKEIISSLKRVGDCRFIVEGIVSITLNNSVLCVIDYGDGTCDEFATMTKDGETVEINLAERKMSRQYKNNNQKGND